MESFVLYPIFSTIISIFLILGTFELGKYLSKKLLIRDLLSNVSILEFQYCTIGLVFLLILLFPLTAFTNYSSIVLKITGFILILFGLNFFFSFKELFKKFKIIFKNEKHFLFYIYLLIIILYFFLALSPLTSADVLDYHAGVALNILRFNKYILLPEWFTGLQAGIGEVLISLGFSVGSEQFGSLVQFTSIISISGILLKLFNKTNFFSSKYLILLIILTCPILIFLLSGNKPQIFFSGLVFLALCLSFVKLENSNQVIKNYSLINILICVSVMGKFSFGLSGFLVWIISTIKIIYKKNFKIVLFVPLIIFLIIFLPFLYWKYLNLGGNLFNYIFSPFPLHLPGYENFLNHNKGSQEIPFPYFIFFTTPSRATEFLGLNTLLLVFLLFHFYKDKKIFVIFSIVTVFIIISNYYASPSARYYLDPILWSTLAISFLKKIKFNKFVEFLFYPQIFLVMIILIYSNYLFLPGAFSEKSYFKVKNKHGYMFSGIDWVNNNISDNSKVIFLNRPIATFKNFAVSGGFNYFTNSKESNYYKNLIKKYNIEYLVYLGNEPDLMHLKNCVGELYKYKKNVGFHATRNPFNKGGLYNAYIFNFDNDKLPDC